MPTKTAKSSKPATVKNLSPKALNAAKAFKGLSAAPTPGKLKGKKAAMIARAVRTYYLG